jgi:hypothetical protein
MRVGTEGAVMVAQGGAGWRRVAQDPMTEIRANVQSFE